MKIEPEIYSYLSGESFKTNLTFNLVKSRQKPVKREAAIIEMIRGKNVIHAGCSDHIGIIDDKIKHDVWLHKLITESSATCIGIDIDIESIAYVRDKLHYDNVFAGNILTDDFAVIRERNWDYIVFGELVEHLDNPVDFLKTIREKYGKYIDKFIVSVPNIYCESQFRNMLKFREIINSDHRFWFTPYTILKVLAASGYKSEDIIFANRQPLTFAELAKRKIFQILGKDLYYPYYYFKTLVISGTLT